jgi:chorismate--pyruvate lyase
MVQPLLDVVSPVITTGADAAWLCLADCRERVPAQLEPWLAEPGLLTARVRAACGAATRLRLLRLEPAPLEPRIARRLGVEDATCMLREIEFTCGARRWIFAQSVFPQSTVRHHPWLRELGDNGLGESLSAVEDVRREPLEYRELPGAHPLAQAAGATGRDGPLWARRAVYRLAGHPILVQEVFLPALGRCD